MIEIFVGSQTAGYQALWRFPGSLEDLRGRWPQLTAAHRALRRAGEPMPADAGCGSLEFLVDCSIGELESYKADAAASMRAEKDGVQVTPRSGEPFALSWPAAEVGPPTKKREVPPAGLAGVAMVLAALIGLLWFCEDCARHLAQITRVLASVLG